MQSSLALRRTVPVARSPAERERAEALASVRRLVHLSHRYVARADAGDPDAIELRACAANAIEAASEMIEAHSFPALLITDPNVAVIGDDKHHDAGGAGDTGWL